MGDNIIIDFLNVCTKELFYLNSKAHAPIGTACGRENKKVGGGRG